MREINIYVILKTVKLLYLPVFELALLGDKERGKCIILLPHIEFIDIKNPVSFSVADLVLSHSTIFYLCLHIGLIFRPKYKTFLRLTMQSHVQISVSFPEVDSIGCNSLSP